jgi:hypothetical protein
VPRLRTNPERPLEPISAQTNTVRFIRFVISHRHQESGLYEGTFRLAYRLRGSSVVTPQDRTVLSDALNWFEENLGTPARFGRTSSKGFYRRNTRGISWFKDTAVDHLARMQQIRLVLERYGYHVQMLTEARVGYVVYEDDYQVVAEPFAETRTSPG